MPPLASADPATTSTTRSGRQRVLVAAPTLLAALLALAVGGWLTQLVLTSEWVMDADEAVHAVEALRRYDRLADGRIGQFLVDSYLPERWQPPVQDHVRWYAIVHSWSLLPSFALLGPGDVAARLPSVAYLMGTCAIVFALTRRLAPRAGSWGGLVAVALLLSAPNVITFTPQALTEACVLFWCYLGLYAYVRFVEQPHDARRAALTGAALSAAVLSKYDHGLLLVACLGVAELVRLRRRPLELATTPARWVFLIPAAAFALWLAHPDKLQAFRDTLAHPAYGTWRVVAANALGSWIYEYSSSLGALVLIAGTFAFAVPRLGDARLRAVWIYALLATLLLVSRARFQFRYNLVEVPAFFVLAGALTPALIEGVASALATLRRARVLALAVLAAVGGAFVLGARALVLGAPQHLQPRLEGALEALLSLSSSRFGLSRTPAEYAQALLHALQRTLELTDVSVVGLGAALLGLALWLASAWLRRTPPARHRRALIIALALATLPGALAFAGRAGGMVRWEWEGSPGLHAVLREIAAHAPARGRVLLGGGWDQLTNNTVRWYLQTRYLRPRPAFDDLEVVGDMIGSLVLPEEPRVEHWARVLREDSGVGLPERVVLLDWREDFLYSEAIGPEVPIYRAVLEQRPAYDPPVRRTFDELGLELEVWTRRAQSVPQLLHPDGLATAAEPGPTGQRTRGAWPQSDKSWRHLACPWLR